MNLQSRFARALEARYADRVAQLIREDSDERAAHHVAFEENKYFGNEGLEDLRKRGLFPWPQDKSVQESTGTVQDLTQESRNA